MTANTLSVRVTRKQREAEGVVSLELCHPEGCSLPAFTPGAHIDLHIKPGLIRQYSLFNHPDERDHYLIAVLRDPASRGGSTAIHDEVMEGDLIPISKPRNNFPLVRARRSMLFAGGIEQIQPNPIQPDGHSRTTSLWFILVVQNRAGCRP